MAYYFPIYVSSYYIVTTSSPFYRLLPYLMNTLYLIEPKHQYFGDIKDIKSLVEDTKGFESIRTSMVVPDEGLDYSNLKVPNSFLNKFSKEHQKEFQVLTKEFSDEKKYNRFFYDLIKQAFDIDVAGGGLLWISSHPLGIQIKYVYTRDFEELDDDRQSGFLMETLNEIGNEIFSPGLAAEPQKNYSSGKLTPKEIADALDDIDSIDSDTFKYLSDKLISLGLRIKLNPKKHKLLIRKEQLKPKVFIAGINQEVELAPLDKSFYFLILLFADGINITSNLNTRDYENYIEVWLDLYTKLKSSDRTEAKHKIENLCGDQQNLSYVKTRTNKPFKTILKSKFPLDYEQRSEEFIVKYERWNVKLNVELSRDKIGGMGVIEDLLSGKLEVR
ncbi:hypothetical protein [Psychroflexus tropicus]|uniref:hypothetical protein n=1 Tax=Psychroflexus tropicus TaxID=197345 RepID=UPI00035E542A|nr:hypothetical protein [Psychroflexus tropicus]